MVKKEIKNEKKAVAKKTVKKEAPEQKEEKYSIRGNVFDGKVLSAKSRKTITVERILTQYIPKYERYKKIKSKVKAHVPLGMHPKEGDIVRIGETRRISKTKNFVLIKIIK